MKKVLFITLLAGVTLAAKAQTKNNAITEHDAAIKTKDADIMTNIIKPAESDAGGEAPDWDALKQAISTKYDTVTADRTVTKAKIFFYYGKDRPAFCAGIVHYTDNWELINDYPLLSKNAKMILNNSTDPAQFKEAQHWAKLAMDGDSSNADYQTVYQALTDKIAGK